MGLSKGVFYTSPCTRVVLLFSPLQKVCVCVSLFIGVKFCSSRLKTMKHFMGWAAVNGLDMDFSSRERRLARRRVDQTAMLQQLTQTLRPGKIHYLFKAQTCFSVYMIFKCVYIVICFFTFPDARSSLGPRMGQQGNGGFERLAGLLSQAAIAPAHSGSQHQQWQPQPQPPWSQPQQRSLNLSSNGINQQDSSKERLANGNSMGSSNLQWCLPSLATTRSNPGCSCRSPRVCRWIPATSKLQESKVLHMEPHKLKLPSSNLNLQEPKGLQMEPRKLKLPSSKLKLQECKGPRSQVGCKLDYKKSMTM